MLGKETNLIPINRTDEEDGLYKIFIDRLNNNLYEWYASITNNCLYFISDGELYGYTVLRYESLAKPLKFCWKETAEYYIDEKSSGKMLIKSSDYSYQLLSEEEFKYFLNL